MPLATAALTEALPGYAVQPWAMTRPFSGAKDPASKVVTKTVCDLLP